LQPEKQKGGKAPMSDLLGRVRGLLALDEVDPPEDDPRRSPLPRKKRSPLLSLHSSRLDEIFVRKPLNLDDRQICADCLRMQRPVVVNLTVLDVDKARRVFDFLSGVAYALDGEVEEVGDQVFLFSPHSMVITTDLDEEEVETQLSWRE